MSKTININRVCSNAGLAFFTTLSGTTMMGLGLDGAVISLVSAGITGGLAFFTEYNKECGGTITTALNKSLVM